MTAPILMGLAAIPEAPGGGPLGGDEGDSGGFDATLGAAMAAVQPAPAPAVEPSLLTIELVLDGEWRPDEAPEQTADDADAAVAAPVGDGSETASAGPAAIVIGEDFVPLAKSLENWLRRLGGVAVSPPPADSASDADLDAAPIVGSEPPDASEETAAAEDVEAVGDAAIVVDWTSASRAVTTVWSGQLPSPEVATEAANGQQTAQPQAAPKAASPSPTARVVLPADGGLDPDALLALRAIHEPIVEIGGFGFPVEIPAADPATASAVPDPAAAPTPDTPASVRATVAAALLGRAVARFDESRRANGAKVDVGPAREAPAVAGVQPANQSAVTAAAIAPLAKGDEASIGHRNRRFQDAQPGDLRTATPPAAGLAQFTAVVDEPGPAAPAAPVVELDAGSAIARRVDHLMLDLNDGGTDLGRLKVSVTGPTVRATILPNDPVLADRLNVGIRELRQSLEERGFPEPRITVVAPRQEANVWLAGGRDVVADSTAADPKAAAREQTNDSRRERSSEQRQDRQPEGRFDRSRDRRQERQGGQR